MNKENLIGRINEVAGKIFFKPGHISTELLSDVSNYGTGSLTPRGRVMMEMALRNKEIFYRDHEAPGIAEDMLLAARAQMFPNEVLPCSEETITKFLADRSKTQNLTDKK